MKRIVADRRAGAGVPTHPRFSALLIVIGVVWASGCSDATGLARPDDIQPFVGDWEARSLEVREVDPPGRSEELISLGSTFTLNVQPSGTYTAILTTDLGAAVEIGRLDLEGTRVRLLRDYPSEDVSEGTLELLSQDEARLVGPTRYTFSRTEGPADATLDATLVRR